MDEESKIIMMKMKFANVGGLIFSVVNSDRII
jgi:hypothetical protein